MGERSVLGPLAAIVDALDRRKAIVPTGGGALIELDAEAYTYKLSGTAVMVCDADDVAALREFLSLADADEAEPMVPKWQYDLKCELLAKAELLAGPSRIRARDE